MRKQNKPCVNCFRWCYSIKLRYNPVEQSCRVRDYCPHLLHLFSRSVLLWMNIIKALSPYSWTKRLFLFLSLHKLSSSLGYFSESRCYLATHGAFTHFAFQKKFKQCSTNSIRILFLRRCFIINNIKCTITNNIPITLLSYFQFFFLMPLVSVFASFHDMIEKWYHSWIL